MGGRSAGQDAFQLRGGSPSGAGRLLEQAHARRYVFGLYAGQFRSTMRR